MPLEVRQNVSVRKEASALALFAKRLTDVLLAAMLLIALCPLMLLVAIAIRLDSPGPAFYRQRRVGKQGRYFEIHKFRTMYAGTPDLPTDEMLKRPSPVTRIGRFLRHTSIDELPQLINVLRGDMSLVGPRPALYNQDELTKRRLECGVLRFLPGVTGWAQINGRDELPDHVKVSMDAWYCDNWHYWLDWKILFSTLRAVSGGRGVN